MSEEDVIRRSYGRLLGLERGLTPGSDVPHSIVEDFRSLVQRIQVATGDDLRSLGSVRLTNYFALYNEFFPKVCQLRSYLEIGFQTDDRIVRLGSLLGSLEDSELRSRCGDLLGATGHFDRVINQATLILEDRIRCKVGCTRGLTGVALVNEYIKAKPAESKIVISQNSDEQEGLANICRGIMQALRNETHHRIAEKFSREEAFHVCGFIDRILKLVDGASVRQ